MSQVHLHLLITHLPVFGSILGALVLLYGLYTKSQPTRNAACFVFIISAIGASIAYITGEGAEETVEKIPGVSKNLIDQHEDAAVYALISLIVLGVLSMLSFVLNRFKTSWVRPVAIIIFVLSLVSFGLAAWTGYLGGQIRHTEISAGAVPDTGTGGIENGERD